MDATRKCRCCNLEVNVKFVIKKLKKSIKEKKLLGWNHIKRRVFAANVATMITEF